MAPQRCYAKRLERGRFLWPSPADGIVAISAPELRAGDISRLRVPVIVISHSGRR